LAGGAALAFREAEVLEFDQPAVAGSTPGDGAGALAGRAALEAQAAAGEESAIATVAPALADQAHALFRGTASGPREAQVVHFNEAGVARFASSDGASGLAQRPARMAKAAALGKASATSGPRLADQAGPLSRRPAGAARAAHIIEFNEAGIAAGTSSDGARL
jgi:hypothetical protein